MERSPELGLAGLQLPAVAGLGFQALPHSAGGGGGETCPSVPSAPPRHLSPAPQPGPVTLLCASWMGLPEKLSGEDQGLFVLPAEAHIFGQRQPFRCRPASGE